MEMYVREGGNDNSRKDKKRKYRFLRETELRNFATVNLGQKKVMHKTLLLKIKKIHTFFLFQKHYFQKHKSWILCVFF